MGAALPHCQETACREAVCQQFEGEFGDVSSGGGGGQSGKKTHDEGTGTRLLPRCWDAGIPHGDRQKGTDEVPEEAVETAEDSLLRYYFLSAAYAQGDELDEMVAQDGGYVLEAEERVPVYRHEELNIRVWRQALRLAALEEADVEVLFHYITWVDFLEVAAAPIVTPAVWYSLKQACLESGLAVYAARREPMQLAGDYSGARNLPAWIVEADHCIPIIVPRSAIFNADFPEDRCSPNGQLQRGRDLWTIRLPDEAAALQHVAADNERRYRCVLRSMESEFGPEHMETLDASSYLAYLLDASGKHEDAELLYRRALGGYESSCGWDHPETLRCTSNLAALLQACGRLSEAEPLARRALQGLEAKFGPQHPDTVANVGNLAHLLLSKGSYEEAVLLYRRVLAWREARIGPDSLETASAAADLAAGLFRLNRFDEVAIFEQQALDLRRRLLGPEHHDALQSYRSLAAALLAHHADAEAETVLRQSLAAHVAGLGERHPSTLAVAGSLSSLHEFG